MNTRKPSYEATLTPERREELFNSLKTVLSEVNTWDQTADEFLSPYKKWISDNFDSSEIHYLDIYCLDWNDCSTPRIVYIYRCRKLGTDIVALRSAFYEEMDYNEDDLTEEENLNWHTEFILNEFFEAIDTMNILEDSLEEKGF